jgi:hypothetical protein
VKRRIYLVDVHVSREYTLQVNATNEQEAEELAIEMVQDGDLEPDNQEIEVEDIYEGDSTDLDE